MNSSENICNLWSTLLRLFRNERLNWKLFFSWLWNNVKVLTEQQWNSSDQVKTSLGMPVLAVKDWIVKKCGNWIFIHDVCALDLWLRLSQRPEWCAQVWHSCDFESVTVCSSVNAFILPFAFSKPGPPHKPRKSCSDLS